MAIDAISMVLLAIGFILALYGIMGSKKNSKVLALSGVVLVVFGGLGAFGAIDYKALTGGGQVTTQSIDRNPNPNPNLNTCSANAITSNGKSQADVVARNVENASLGYLAGTITANSVGDFINTGGVFLDSATSIAGATPTYASMSNIPNCGKGIIAATVTTGTGFASSRQVKDVETGNLVNGFDYTDKGLHKFEVQTASADVLSCDASDFSNAISSSWQTNGSAGSEVTKDANGHLFVSGTGTADGNFYFKNTSMIVRGSLNFYIHCQVNNTATVFGAYNEPDGISISYNPNALARFSVNSLTLSSNTPGWALTKEDCRQGVSYNRNARACWAAPTMKSGVLYELKGTLTADLGDPVVGDAIPAIYFDDRQIFRDVGGNAKYSTYSSASGTNQGVGGTIMNFVLN